ncbi:hypothetical protein [Prosthecobacter sp.]|uniref:hypothetical protein n=1 Tax=Prosthecobacter sp. TaxID=1965333 RepID=UPI003783CBA9
MRILFFSCLLLSGTGLISSCATTQSSSSYAQQSQGAEEEEVSGMKKVGGYCLGFLSDSVQSIFAQGVSFGL